MLIQKRCEQCARAYQAPKPKQRFCSCRCRAIWVRRTNEAALNGAQAISRNQAQQEAA